MKTDELQAGEEPEVTMTDSGEKNPGEDPDFDEADPTGRPGRARGAVGRSGHPGIDGSNQPS